ncbi:MAG: U32 family peptidase C-terminal domain-containing protein, partial [Planctomycetaceae bacterium]|nr:U32 family peptidase C-terminal domain-containing protein [Planctomycetaceae bacterium]
ANLQKFVGDVIEIDDDFLTVEVKNKFEVGEEIELMTPAGNIRFTLDQMFDAKGNPEDVAPGSGHFRKIPLNDNIPNETREALKGHAGQYALLMKFV